ncbi:MAG: 30S ribosomal protein S16 [Flavobacteriales bacterium]|nr:30S ribosomal protein S16 [Flavobacteriales bacterium]
MPTRIRLQRKGKKGNAYYHVVVADQRSPRDGKYIERIGAYNPNVAPAMVEVDREKALQWLQMGAQPSDTARAILSYTGVIYKNHLQNGVKKGAFDQAEADRRFEVWMNEKQAKVEAKRSRLNDAAASAYKERVAVETKKSHDRADALTAKLAAAVATEAPAEEAPPAEGGEAQEQA